MFNGTTNYSETTSTTGSLNVEANTTPYYPNYTVYYIIIAIIIIAVCGTVGYFVYNRRKRAK